MDLSLLKRIKNYVPVGCLGQCIFSTSHRNTRNRFETGQKRHGQERWSLPAMNPPLDRPRSKFLCEPNMPTLGKRLRLTWTRWSQHPDQQHKLSLAITRPANLQHTLRPSIQRAKAASSEQRRSRRDWFDVLQNSDVYPTVSTRGRRRCDACACPGALTATYSGPSDRGVGRVRKPPIGLRWPRYKLLINTFSVAVST